MGKRMSGVALAAWVAVVWAGGASGAPEVGSAAPPIQVKTWVVNSPVTLESAKGKVLVVEFWATWCGPCRQTIPRVNKLQSKYNDKNVVFVGVTREDEAIVKDFLKTVPMTYHVGLDDGGAMHNTYMKGVEGIPHAFVVGRDGKVVWAGHPMSGMDKVLRQLVAGTFDAGRAKKLAEFQAKLQAAARKRDVEQILAALDETIKAVPDDGDAYQIKMSILRQQGKAAEAQAVLLDMAKACAQDPDVLSNVALQLCTAPGVASRDLAKALALAQQAVEASKGESSDALGALARAHYELGHLALASQFADKAAAAASGDEAKELAAQADFYRKELARRRADADAKL